MSWTEERIESLKKLWADGLSASQIAIELGEDVTRNAVIGKIHRLKLGGRRKSSSGGRPVSASKQRHASDTKSKKVVPRLPDVRTPGIIRDPAPPSMEPDLVIPIEDRLGLLQLKEDTCKWPMGDPLLPDFHFCGRTPERGPYCEVHANRAYHQLRKRA